MISADSDPINGAWVFHVQAPGPQPGGIAAQVLEGTDLTVSAFYLGGRFLDFLLLLLCVGGIAALVGRAPRDVGGRAAPAAPRGVAAGTRHRPPARPGQAGMEPGALVVQDANLALAGDWQLRIEARRGEFDLFTKTISVPIEEEP